MMNQAKYATRLMELELDCNFAMFRSRQHEIGWLAHTRPDSCSAVAMMPKVTADKFNRKPIKLMNSKIDKAKKLSYRGLLQHRLDEESSEMVTYSDSSLANHEEMSTQFGFAMFLVHKFFERRTGLIFKL